MDGNFSEGLKTVLADPDAMATISTLAKKFASNQKKTEEGEASSPSPGPLNELMSQPAIASAIRILGDGSRERLALLCAMRPFVKEEKKEKLDRIISTMKTLDLLLSAQKLL